MSTTAASAERRSGLEAALARGTGTLRRRVAAVVLAAVAMLVVLGVALAWRQYEAAQRRALGEMHARVVLAATVFDTYFAGQLSALGAIAGAPSVVRTDTEAMSRYFARLQAARPPLFTGGLAWIDLSGTTRVSDNDAARARLNVADRSFFRVVVSTGRPFVSEGLLTRVGRKRVVVMAVPTRDAQGRTTGVLAGALELRASRNDQRTTELGYQGLAVIDRKGQQLTLTTMARPANRSLLPRLRRGDGVIADTRGLEGASGRVVAYANSKAPSWITAIDRPRSAVFASARHGLQLELVSIAGATLTVLSILGWALARSRRDLEEEREHVRHWDELAQSLGQASAATDVSTALGSALVTAFPGSRAIIALASEDGHTLRIRTHAAEGAAALDRSSPGVDEIARLALASGSALRYDRGPLLRSVVELLGGAFAEPVGGLYAVPLRGPGGALLGSATLLLPADGSLDDADVALVDAHAEHAGRALVRAHRYEREHDVAVSLQRSLLPESLPLLAGVELAGRYSAGGVGLEVGGDWYDAVHRPDGILHLTVGDVAGRGIQAAVLMGQLRNAFRALALEHTSPAEIAQRLARHVPEGEMATAVFLSLDPYTGELRYASAGHPPPLLLDLISGEVSVLEGASSPPLGWAGARRGEEATLVLPSQMTLLAYTDGLVERRDAAIDVGIERAGRLLRERPELPPDATVALLLDELVAPLSASDDVALVLLRISEVPAVLHIEIPAEPMLLRGLRARLHAWMTRRGIEDERQADVVLAVSEACNNAIEHAYLGQEGTIDLTLEHRAGMLRVAVEDHGAWRPPRADPTRGRGLLILDATMDTVTVAQGRTGTRVEFELSLQRASGDGDTGR